VSPHRPDPRATCQARSNTWLIRVLCGAKSGRTVVSARDERDIRVEHAGPTRGPDRRRARGPGRP
jgi:hypothetical protein